MTKVALRGIGARKLRAFTTWLAIFLGVALVAGTYVLTDTINASFSDIFSESLKGTDVAITARQEIQSDEVGPPAFPARLIDRVRKVDGVEAAAGSVFSVGRFVDTKGDPIGHSFAPNFISSLLPPRFETLDYVKGRKPRSDTEVSIDTQTADTGDLRVGGKLRLAGTHDARTYDIVGLTKLGDTSFGGAGIAQVLLPEAQRITDREGQFDQISVAAKDGVSPEELRDRIARVMPRQVQVETGEQAAQRQSDDIADGPRLPPDRAARVRGRVAVRRRLPDLQHLLDHGGSAHARVRDAAHARRLAPAAARDCGDRGAGARSARRGGGARGRRGLRVRDQRAVQGLRDRPAEHRDGGDPADGDRLADRGRAW